MSPRATTWLLDVIVQIDGSGVAAPIAVVQPVKLDENLVDCARLHSSGLLRESDLRVHDAVIIERNAAHELPVIVTVLADQRKGEEPPLLLPTTCPSCAADLRQSADDVVCPNATCPKQLVTRVVRLASADAFDIAALDAATAVSLIEAGLLASPADVFRLRDRHLRHWTQQPVDRARELIRAIDASKEIYLDRFLIALSIRGADPAAARSLAEQARTLTGLKHLSPGTMARLPHVGAGVAENVMNFLREPANRKMMAKMLRAGVVILPLPARAARRVKRTALRAGVR